MNTMMDKNEVFPKISVGSAHENTIPKVKRFQKKSLKRLHRAISRSSSDTNEVNLPAVVIEEPEVDRKILSFLDEPRRLATPGNSPIPETYDSDFDTDLEDEEPTIEFDVTGKVVYQAACKNHGVIPSSYVQRALSGDTLKLNNLGMSVDEVLVLCVPLLTNMSINSLFLSSNRFGPEGMIYLTGMLQENINITNLDLSENHLGTKGAQLVVEILEINDTLKSLNLSGNNFVEGDAKYFAEALRIGQLKTLNLSHNEFREEAGRTLCPAIAENDILEELDLSWNHLRLKGARGIAEGVLENVSIKKLNLSWNGFSNDGCSYLANVLSENRILQELDLSSNRITVEGVKYLCRSLAKNESLVNLKLSNNSIGTAGACALLETIKKNSTSRMQCVEILDLYVDKSVEYLLNEVKKVKPKFILKHGASMRFSDPYSKIVRPKDAWMGDPLTLLLRYMSERNMRLVDLFSQFDTDDSWTLTIDEFKKGVKQAGIPLSILQLEQLVNRLDVNNDGEIDFKEMMSGHKKHRNRERRVRQDILDRDRMRLSLPQSPSSSRPSSRAGSRPLSGRRGSGPTETPAGGLHLPNIKAQQNYVPSPKGGTKSDIDGFKEGSYEVHQKTNDNETAAAPLLSKRNKTLIGISGRSREKSLMNNLRRLKTS